MLESGKDGTMSCIWVERELLLFWISCTTYEEEKEYLFAELGMQNTTLKQGPVIDLQVSNVVNRGWTKLYSGTVDVACLQLAFVGDWFDIDLLSSVKVAVTSLHYSLHSIVSLCSLRGRITFSISMVYIYSIESFD